MLPVIYYTVLRLLAFAVPLGLLIWVGVPPMWSALVAAVTGLAVSLVFLRTSREKVSGSLYEARHPAYEHVGADEEAEDDLYEDEDPRPAAPSA